VRLRRHRLFVFLAAAFAAKLVVLAALEDHPLLQPAGGLEAEVYSQLASRILAGHPALGPGLYFLPPLYAYFLAVVLRAVNTLAAVRVAQILLGTAAIALVFLAARTWFGRRAAWLSALLAALTGPFTFNEILTVPSALDPFLTAAALAALAVALVRGRPPWFAGAGALLGLGALNGAHVLLPAMVLVIALAALRPWRAAAFMAAGIAVAVTPVLVRNVVVAGELTPLSSRAGLNFYIGNNAGADGAYHPPPGIASSAAGQLDDARRVAEQSLGRSLSDAEVSSYFYDLGRTWVQLHPADALALFMRKVRYAFNGAHIPFEYSYPFYAYDANTLLAILFVGPWLLVPLGIVGLALAMPSERRIDYAIWLSFVPACAIATAMVFVTDRSRLPLLVPLCIGGGAGVDEFLSRRRGFRLHVEGAAVAALALLALVVNLPVPVDDGRTEERLKMAEARAGAGDAEGAERWLALAEQGRPPAAAIEFRVGHAFLRAGQAAPAMRHFERALTIEPRNPDAEYALGQALVDAGRPAEAIPHLREGLKGGVRVELAGFDLARALDETGDRAGALQVLQGLRPSNPDDGAAWVALGGLAMDLRAASLAAAFYNQAIRALPGAARPRHQMALALAMLGRYPEAINNLQQAIALDPSDATAHLNLAVAYAEVGRTAEARAEAEQALRLKPDYDRARELLKQIKP
jgi:tetratricopeptide (TPR) repeat protein